MRDKTLRGYTAHVKLHLIPHLGQVLLNELDVGHLDRAFTTLLRQDEVTIATAHRVLATLRSALNTAARETLIGDNPVRYLKLPPARRPIRDLLTLLNQAHTWADTHPAAWAAVWAKGTGLPAGIMLNAAKDAASVPVPITPAVVAAEQQVSDAFTAAGLIPGHVNFSDFVDTRFNSVLGSG